MPRLTPKRFVIDEPVMVQRKVDAPWEPATYVRNTWKGWHTVQLPDGQQYFIDSMSGEPCGPDNQRGYLTDKVIVPSRRIRKPGRVRKL